MKKLLSNILPETVKEYYKKNKRKIKSKKRELLKENNQITTQEDVEAMLLKIGIKTGDVLMLHSSLSQIGYVEGSAQTLINAILKVIGHSGTMVMPAFPAKGFNYDYLKSKPVFDLLNTPSNSGIITETFRKMKGVKRSLHPTDSVCAIGKKSELITGSHFNQITPYNKMSPFYKLIELHAKIILLGVDLTVLTNLHTLEDAIANFKFPVYHSTIFDCVLINEKKQKVTVKTKCHDPRWSKKRKCNELLPLFETAGVLKKSKLGNAQVFLLDANKMFDCMLKNYNEKGITMYTPQGSI